MFTCHYSILRFLPYVETGEFANIGVVLLSMTGRYFGFRLLQRRIARVTHFFDIADGAGLRTGLRVMDKELKDIEGQLKRLGFDRRMREVDTKAVEMRFAELIRPRETLFRFSPPRALLAENPSQELEALFNRVVQRDFVTKEYAEAVLDRGVRRLLSQNQLSERYLSEDFRDEKGFYVRFPFVAKTAGDRLKIIKPLHLTHIEASKAIDHGLHWADRVRQLKKRNLLQGEILFPIQGRPDNVNVVTEVEQLLRDEGAKTSSIDTPQAIIDFARLAA